MFGQFSVALIVAQFVFVLQGGLLEICYTSFLEKASFRDARQSFDDAAQPDLEPPLYAFAQCLSREATLPTAK